MKLLFAILLMNAGFTYCINSNTNLQNTKRESLRKENQFASLTHSLERRFTDEDEHLRECRNNAAAYSCRNGYTTQLVNIYLNCGQSSEAILAVAHGCDRNSNGEYCNIVSRNDYSRFRSGNYTLGNARTACFSIAIHNQACTPECANALQALRRTYGCCINSVLNYTTTPFPSLQYSLWRKCGVETVGECENRINVSVIHASPACTEEETTKRVSDYICAQNNTQFIARYDAEGCETLSDELIDQCRVNSQRKVCVLLSNNNDQLNPILAQCSVNQISCPETCRNGLQSVRDHLGCCLNFLYNKTINSNQDHAFATSYALWKQCNVVTPPHTCPSLLNRHTPTSPTTNIVTQNKSNAPPNNSVAPPTTSNVTHSNSNAPPSNSGVTYAPLNNGSISTNLPSNHNSMTTHKSSGNSSFKNQNTMVFVLLPMLLIASYTKTY